MFRRCNANVVSGWHFLLKYAFLVEVLLFWWVHKHVRFGMPERMGDPHVAGAGVNEFFQLRGVLLRMVFSR